MNKWNRFQCRLERLPVVAGEGGGVKPTRRASVALSLPAVLLIVGGLAIPATLMLLFPPDTTLGEIGTRVRMLVTDDFDRGIVLRTLTTALIVTGVCLILGFPVAYLLSRRAGRFTGALLAAAIFPLLLSTVVRSYGWLVVLGRNGVIGKMIVWLGLADEAPQLLYTRTAVVLGLSQLFLPLAIVPIYSAVSQIDISLDEAASGLGARRLQVLRSVVLPLATPGIVLATTLVFAGSVTAYTTPYLLGGSRQRVLSTQLATYSSTTLNWAAASATAMAMTLLVVLVAIGQRALIGRRGAIE